MRVLGAVEWIADEALFHAVTALSGSGPGYVLRFIEAMADAGRALGLPEELASRLAVETVSGSALLASASDESPAELADRVASPGGTTRERSEEHTSELQSLMRISYAVFCLKKKKKKKRKQDQEIR